MARRGLLTLALFTLVPSAAAQLPRPPQVAGDSDQDGLFFTDSLPGQPVEQVGHGGSRAGYASAFVLRPEDDEAVCILVNADVSTVALSDLAKAILDEF